jgi:hypothetical protein
VTTRQIAALVIVLILAASYTYNGLRRIRYPYARRRARAIFVVLEGLALAVAIVGVFADAAPIGVVGIVLGFLFDLGSTRLVALTGGPAPALGLNRAFNELVKFNAQAHEIPLSTEDQAWLDQHLAGLDQWRSADTNALIDAWREVTIAQYAVLRVDPETWEKLNDRFLAEAHKVWRTPSSWRKAKGDDARPDG